MAVHPWYGLGRPPLANTARRISMPGPSFTFWTLWRVGTRKKTWPTRVTRPISPLSRWTYQSTDRDPDSLSSTNPRGSYLTKLHDGRHIVTPLLACLLACSLARLLACSPSIVFLDGWERLMPDEQHLWYWTQYKADHRCCGHRAEAGLVNSVSQLDRGPYSPRVREGVHDHHLLPARSRPLPCGSSIRATHLHPCFQISIR